MMDRAISSQPAMDFVRLLIDDVVPAMNNERLTIQRYFRYCMGTIDLVVIDGKAVLISLITKQKR
jgi:hypothetical protein